MAFAATGLRKIAECLFVYDAGADTAATVTGANYFNAKWRELKQNDVIIVIGAARTTVDVVAVTSATNATTVAVTATEGVTAT